MRVAAQVCVFVGEIGEIRRRSPRPPVPPGRPPPLRDRQALLPGRSAGIASAASSGGSCAAPRRRRFAPVRRPPAWRRRRSPSRWPGSRGCVGWTLVLRQSLRARGGSHQAAQRLPASGRLDLPARSPASGTAAGPGRRLPRRRTPGGGRAPSRRGSTRLHHKSAERRTCAEATSAARGATDQPQDTLTLKSLVIIPAIGFFMSAPWAWPVMV